MIKVTVGEQKTQSEKPRLMINNTKDRVVLMQKYGCGIVVYEKNEYYGIGYIATSWAMEDFTDFNEPITLQNA